MYRLATNRSEKRVEKNAKVCVIEANP